MLSMRVFHVIFRLGCIPNGNAYMLFLQITDCFFNTTK